MVLVAELLDDAAQPGALFATVDLARDADVVHRRHEHQEAARQRDVAGQTSALGAKRLLGHLDDHVLAFFQQLFNLRLGRVFLALFAVATAAAAATPFAALPARRRDFHGALGTGTLGTIGTIGTLGTFGTLVVVIVLVVLIQVGDDVGDIEEAVAFETNVHKRRLHAGQDFRDTTLVDVADDAAVLFALDEQLSELIVLENGDTRFVAIRGDDHFLVHGTLWRKVSASVRKPAHPHVEDQPEPG